MTRQVMEVTVLFWCSGCMQQRQRTLLFDVTQPARVNVFALLCARCNERELTRPLPQADGCDERCACGRTPDECYRCNDGDERGDDSGPLVSV